MTDLVERLKRAEGSPTLRGVLLGKHNAEKTCLDASKEIERRKEEEIRTKRLRGKM